MTVATIIKEAVETIPDTHYLRATDTEANIALDEIDLEGLTVCIYNNLASVSVQANQMRVPTWPIEIKILKLADMDDNDEEGDIIRNQCMDVAHYLQSTITTDERANEAGDVSNYEINMLDQVKLYDKILTGVELSFELMMPAIC